ncbi:hypothetical protein GCM10007425_02270 [Lysinibacillus alkalisoli]|uniref:Uncharacterized protein n=1 Tax=Lysinibacillus alkalisoli TaxID=1911548 RepID=A0A917D6K8_9BACI|nr:hypothetical protein GCM10007425_02270 [Lysinibacillus alkalisoli]
MLLFQRLERLYKNLYRVCSNIKATSADITVFVAYKYISKLSFGNVYLNAYVFTYIDKINYM